MDTTDKLNRYRQIIENALTAVASIPHAYGEIEDQTSFERQTDEVSGKEQHVSSPTPKENFQGNV